jgi:glycosyltransferase involved in cell wall biosynthesis
LVVGWNREGHVFHDSQSPKKEIIGRSNGLPEVHVKILGVRAPFGMQSLFSYIPMLVYFPIFWSWVLVKLIINRPQVVHACDLDAVLPCYIYKLIFRKKMIFEVFDRYAMTFIPSKFGTLYSAINLIEEYFSGKADVLITVAEKLLKTFPRRPEHCEIILNCAEDHILNLARSENGKDNVFILVYTGGIKRGRSLENITAAVKDLSNSEFVTAGPIIDKELFHQILAFPNVKYRGLLDPTEALVLEANADVIIGLYDLNVPENRFAMPNKVFEAMMSGVPIITNVAPELVRDLDFGIMVNYDNVNQIKSTIALLRDNKELRIRLGNNGRKAFLEKYNWANMEHKLYEIYDELIGNAYR